MRRSPRTASSVAGWCSTHGCRRGAADGSFVPGTAIYDNVHPTPETAVVVGSSMAHALTLATKFLP